MYMRNWATGLLLSAFMVSGGWGCPLAKCKDNAQADPGVSVSFTTTTNVSGGGSALNDAVAAAGSNTRLRITDSSTYDPVSVSNKTNLTIVAQVGETPVVRRTAPASFPNTTSGWALKISGSVNGLRISGIKFVDHGNRNSLSFADNGLIVAREDCTGLTNLIVEDSTFEEASDSPLDGLNGVLLACGGSGGTTYDNVVVRRCVFDTLGAGSNNTGENLGAVSVFGFEDVWIQNCWIKRNNALVVRASSHQRGVVIRNVNTVVENVLVDDIGTAGSNEAFKTVSSSGTHFGSATGPASLRNCAAYNAKRGYRAEQPSSTMTVSKSVFHADTTGIVDRAFRLTAGSALVVRDSVAVGAGDGTAFESASITEDHNDIFNFGTLGKTLDATDLQRDPLFNDVANNDWSATDVQVASGASDGGAMGVRYTVNGEEVIWCGA